MTFLLLQMVAFDAPFQDELLKKAYPSPAFSDSLSSVNGSTELDRAISVLEELLRVTIESIWILQNEHSAAFTTGVQPEWVENTYFQEPPLEFFTIAQQLQVLYICNVIDAQIIKLY